MSQGIPHTSFTTGELTPAAYGRVDFAKYYDALRTCRNFIPSKYGGVDNRSGTTFIGLVDDSNEIHRLIRFEFNTTGKQAYVLVLGNLTMQIIFNGVFLTDIDDNPITIVTPWASADLALLKYTQSADVVTVCHPTYPTQQIERLSATNWQIIPFAPVNGPFQDINIDQTITVTTTDVTGAVSVSASKDLFSADMVGLEFYIHQAPDNTTPIWEVATTITTGEIVLYGDNYYQAATGGTTGTYAPVVTQGSQKDGHTGVLWNYLHSGFGVVQIIEFIDAQTVTAIVLSQIPNSIVAGADQIPISTISPGAYSPLLAGQVLVQVVTNTAHGFTTGDKVTITGVGGSIGPYVNGTWTVITIDTVTFSLQGNMASGTYETGTGYVAAAATIASIPSYLWALPSWGMTAQGYPGTTAYFQDRQLFGGSYGAPFNFWMSTVEGFNDFTVSNPVLDTDGITYKLLGNDVVIVRHLLELTFLLIFTSGGIKMVQGGGSNSNVITPSSINLSDQGANPVSDVPPIKINNYALFLQEKGQQVRTLGYSFAENAFVGKDITVLSNHLLQFNTIVDWCYQETPYSCVWSIRNDGVLLSLTFLPEQEITAWAHHDTTGTYESCICITENDVLTGLPSDVVYFIVNRPGIGRCIERMRPRYFQDQRDAFFVDCGLTYDGRPSTPATHFTGADHLAGQTVACLADGYVIPPFVMPTNGEFDLDTAAYVVHVGLPYTSDFETLEIASPRKDIRDKMKAVNNVSFIVQDSGTFQCGPDMNNLVTPKMRTTEDYGDPDALYSGMIDQPIPCMWNKLGRVFARQANPLPLTILAVIPQMELGGH